MSITEMMIPNNIADAIEMYPGSVHYCEKWKSLSKTQRVQHQLENSEEYRLYLLHADIIKAVDLYRAQCNETD